MPPGQKLTNAEKCRRYKEKMKNADPDKFAMKARDANKKCRANRSMEKKLLIRQQNSEHKRQKRVEEKLIKMGIVDKTNYKTNAAFGKARAKVARSLPADPHRARAVLESNLETINKQLGSVETVLDVLPPRSACTRGLSEGTVNSITKFYYRQDVSIEFPGRKDYVRVRQQDGSFSKMTKHILCLTLRECFSEYKKENPEVEVHPAKFYSLRPPNVLLRHKLPHNVCTCIYHENINHMIKAVHKHNPEFPADHRTLLRVTTCSVENITNEVCQFGKCEECNKLNSLDNFVSLIGSDVVLLKSWFVKYNLWEKEAIDGSDRLRKVEKYESLYSVMEKMLGDWIYFRFHRLVKVKQDERFNQLHVMTDPQSVLFQFDFSENAEVIEQDEAQSAHWWHLQVSLFTACAWVNQEKNCFAVVSDYKNHDKYISIMCVIKILFHVMSKYPELKEVHLFSDGAAQTFKQCYFLTAVTHLTTFLQMSEDQISITYDLFATAHGKGAVDGIGGTVKRQVRSEIMSRKEIVSNARDYATVAEKVCPNVKIIYISKEEVENSKNVFNEIFENAKTLPGTRKVHHLDIVKFNTVKYSKYFGSSEVKEFSFK